MKEKYFTLFVLATAVVFLFVGTVTEKQRSDGQSTMSETSVIYQGEAIQDDALYLFYSPTCPHCHKERAFLKNVIEVKYPDFVIYQYEVAKRENVSLMRELAKQHGIEDLLGGVPLTFVGEHYFLGYDEDETTGKDIETAIRQLIEEGVVDVEETLIANTVEEKNEVVREESERYFDVPFLGRVYAGDFPLPILAILLGFLDGFNVCSLGALVLIIGLTLKLQNRKAIILLGGTFIATTALVYGALIVLWAKLFDYFGSQVDYIKILVAVMALGGGVYFLKEYFRMRNQGAMCELSESKFINNLMEKTGKAFEDNTKLFGLLGTVLVFAGVLAIVEFPCSAATPLVFAGVLSSSGLSATTQTLYIALFVLFYMLDEIIIFGIAAYRLKVWMTSGTFTKYAVLAEAIILIIIGLSFVAPLLM